MLYFTTLMLAIFITVSLVPALKSIAIRLHMVDTPNARKVHDQPMPTIGGIAMVLGAAIPLSFTISYTNQVSAILLGGLIIAISGLLDDIFTLGYKQKFSVQIVAALVVIFVGDITINSLGSLLPLGMVLPVYIAVPLTLLCIIGVTNAINLADGLDGLAGGVSLLSLLAIAYLAYAGGSSGLALIAMASVGAIFGFLRFNTHPATIFMGDTGSQFLGFLLVTLSIALTNNQANLSPLVILPIIGFPIIDTLTVMSERLFRGNSPFVADKNHFHHKFMRLGFFHTEAVFVIYLLHSSLVTWGFLCRFSSDWLLLFSYLAFACCIIATFWYVDRIGWTFKRTGPFDSNIKSNLKVLKEKQYAIKISFKTIYYLLPVLFILTALLPRQIPTSYAIFSLVLAAILLLSLFLPEKWRKTIWQSVLFLAIPVIVFHGETSPFLAVHSNLYYCYIVFFPVIMTAALLTLKFTRRTKGYQASPLDFLILFIAVIIPNIPDPEIQKFQMGLLATKIITFFFCYAILLGELRKLGGWITITTMAGLILFAMQAFIIF